MIASGILILTSLFLQGCAQNVKGSLRKQVDIVEEIEKIEKKCGRDCWEECERDCLEERGCEECQKKCLEKEKECYDATKYKKHLIQLKKNVENANTIFPSCNKDIIPFVKKDEDKEKCKQIAKKMKLRFKEVSLSFSFQKFPHCFRRGDAIRWNKSDTIDEKGTFPDQTFGICEDTNKIGWKKY